MDKPEKLLEEHTPVPSGLYPSPRVRSQNITTGAMTELVSQVYCQQLNHIVA
jgi:hypothetical protein